MTCGHGTYQCTPPLIGNGPNGHSHVMVCMWCSTCGAITLRVPQVEPADERMLALRTGAVPLSKGAKA